MLMERAEFDFQRPDNPNRIYSTEKVSSALAFMVNNIAAKTLFKDVSCIIVKPEQINIGSPRFGLDIEGDEKQKELVEKFVNRIRPRLERLEGSQRFNDFLGRATLRVRTMIAKHRLKK